MISWWTNLSLKGKFYFWGLFGIGVNAVIFFLGVWMPVLLFTSFGFLLIGFVLPSDT